MEIEKYEKQRAIIEHQIKEDDDKSENYLEGYINALYDYNLINDNQFGELYNLIFKEG